MTAFTYFFTYSDQGFRAGGKVWNLENCLTVISPGINMVQDLLSFSVCLSHQLSRLSFNLKDFPKILKL